MQFSVKTRMRTSIKAKFFKSDEQTNIENIEILQLLHNIILYLPKNHDSQIIDENAIISCKKCT